MKQLIELLIKILVLTRKLVIILKNTIIKKVVTRIILKLNTIAKITIIIHKVNITITKI
jgi:hypothetical protein